MYESSVQGIVWGMWSPISLGAIALVLSACGDAVGGDESFPSSLADTQQATDIQPTNGLISASDPAEPASGATEDPGSTLLGLLENGHVSLSTPEPLLPNAAREELVSQLSSTDFSALCEPYLENAVSAAHNAAGLCSLRGLAAAEDAGALGLEDYRGACRQARQQCEAEAVERSSKASAVWCRGASSCGVTVGEVDHCNRSLALLDLAILMPAATWPIPNCEELSPEVGEPLANELHSVILQTYREQNLGSVVDDCAPVQSRCLSIAVPLPVRGD